jgi:hypothetical protein
MRQHREGKGTQALATMTVFPTWATFPSHRYRDARPGIQAVMFSPS